MNKYAFRLYIFQKCISTEPRIRLPKRKENHLTQNVRRIKKKKKKGKKPTKQHSSNNFDSDVENWGYDSGLK